ncbi:hypothetical protein BOQ62_03420 [Chryseobacterium sp. CH21]|uniref:hypothetical protein n=1 Tax=Chryseobacterium sp. CH21 TaxID=713556 RepID=UPI00100B5A03|nr:hypothetical protein [Chryseobacterium sp. CH21]RXM40900.1 hypothetical protein BOQ62_03420 [Chryseobacterium sp. CH21]
MKKLLSAVVMLTVSSFTFAQVGINTSSPESTLDIRAKNHLGTVSSTDGVLVPRVNDLTVNGSVNGQLVYLVSNTGSFTQGFYYWNGTAWTGFGGASGDNTNDAWINDTSNVMVKLGTQSDGATARNAGTDFVAKDNGAVGIGTNLPDASAILDITSTNRGVILPRVALKSITDQSTINTPATGILVYNTGADSLKYVGYVFWNGSEWRSLENSTLVNPSITSLQCNAATLSPTQLIANVPYSGYMYVPYTGGNGASYGSGTPIPSTGNTGLTATLQPGKLNLGDGSLTYLVTGTPSQSSPNLASFALGSTFGTPGCTANVGTFAASGNSVKKLLYSGTTSDANQVIIVGDMMFRFDSGVPCTSCGKGPQIRLVSDPGSSRVIYVGGQTNFATNGYEYINNPLTFTSANYTTYQNLYSGSANSIAVGELNVLNIVDYAKNIYYRVTFYINGPNPYTFLIIAEQF